MDNKYRGFSSVKNKWVYGQFLWWDYTQGDMPEFAHIGHPWGGYHQVFRNSVGQQISGNLYEGDIVEVKDDDEFFEPVRAVVRWMGPDYPAYDLAVMNDRGKWEPLVSDYNSISADLDYTVIGTIFENPELLSKDNPIGCTLSDEQLVEKAERWLDKLTATGGKCWSLPVPANPNEDVDLVLTELLERFKKQLQ